LFYNRLFKELFRKKIPPCLLKIKNTAIPATQVIDANISISNGLLLLPSSSPLTGDKIEQRIKTMGTVKAAIFSFMGSYFWMAVRRLKFTCDILEYFNGRCTFLVTTRYYLLWKKENKCAPVINDFFGMSTIMFAPKAKRVNTIKHSMKWSK
jgi:hypothetical protein